MKTTVKFILGILMLALYSPAAAQLKHTGGKAANAGNRILVVVSSYGKDSGKVRPGYEFDEFSQAWLVFKANGFTMDVASPKGGSTKPDEFNKNKVYNKTVLADKDAMASLENTIPTVKLDPSHYTAVYIVGGKGAMFDLPFDPSLQDIITSIYQKKNGVISAVCHGPAAFVNVKTDGKKYLLDGKTVTGFCNAEEEKFGKKWVKDFPFLLEDKLKSRNAVYEQAQVMLPNVIVSGNLITGQNPYSTTWLAEEVVKALGRQPVKRTLYPDENSMYLVKKAVAGEFEWAKTELSKNKAAYDMELIAAYGYYRVIDEKAGNKETQLALNIIELVTPYMYKDVLELERAKGHIRLNEKEKAKEILQVLVKKEPTMEKAATLLKEVESK